MQPITCDISGQAENKKYLSLNSNFFLIASGIYMILPPETKVLGLSKFYPTIPWVLK